MIPKEHGSWAMWVMPFIIGMAGAGKIGIETILIFRTCLSVFSARTAFASAIRLRRRSSSLYLKCAIAGLVELLIAAGLASPILSSGNVVIAIIGFLALLLLVTDLMWIKGHNERNILAELVGIAGFALTSPAVYIGTTGMWSWEALILWFVSFGFFAGSVFFVKLRVVRGPSIKSGNRNLETHYSRLALGYVSVVLGTTILLTILRLVPGWIVLAFLPWILGILSDVYRWGQKKSFQQFGWALVAHALYFTLLVSLIFALN